MELSVKGRRTLMLITPSYDFMVANSLNSNLCDNQSVTPCFPIEITPFLKEVL